MNDDLTTELGRTLGDRAAEMDGSTLHLADVQRRARSIRRRRQATGLVGVAAAVALIVPTAALAGHHVGHDTDPLPATQSVTPSPSPTDGRQPPQGVLDVSDLPTGPPPTVDYVVDGVLHFADGGTGPVDTRYPPDGVVQMDDASRVWQVSHGGTTYVQIQDSDGTFHDPVRTAGGLVVNPSHTVVAWLTPTGQVVVWGARATDPRPIGTPVPGSGWRIGAVTGEDCSLACSVYVNAPDAHGDLQPWEVSDNGTQRLRDGGFRTVADVSAANLMIGYTGITDSGSCSKVAGGGEYAGWRTCRHTLVSFSPDGRLVLGGPAYPDGAGANQVAVYDDRGRLQFDRRATAQSQPTIGQIEWEDATHLLASVYQDGDWSLVRFAVDGSMEYAVAPTPGEDVTQDPFVLPTKPLPGS